MDEPEKLDLRSHDLSEDRKQEWLRFFPEIRTEGGKIERGRVMGFVKEKRSEKIHLRPLETLTEAGT